MDHHTQDTHITTDTMTHHTIHHTPAATIADMVDIMTPHTIHHTPPDISTQLSPPPSTMLDHMPPQLREASSLTHQSEPLPLLLIHYMTQLTTEADTLTTQATHHTTEAHTTTLDIQLTHHTDMDTTGEIVQASEREA